jgi:tetratricopeptide (TPR) repeat protein
MTNFSGIPMKATYKTLLTVFLVFIGVQGCAIFHSPFKKETVRSSLLPGINPEIYKIAKVKADSLIPSKESESEADALVRTGKIDLEVSEALWRAVEVYRKRAASDSGQNKIVPETEEVAVSSDDVMVVYLKKDTVKTKIKTVEKDSLSEPIILMMARQYMDNAMQMFLKAKEINRFNLETIQDIAGLYAKKAEIFKDSTSSHESIRQYEYVARYQKGYHILFSRLGANYEAINDWKNAYSNYREALRVFLATAKLDFSTDLKTDREDSLHSIGILADYWIDKARAETKLFLADSAVVSWLNALSYSQTESENKYIETNLQKIMWDSLNIRAFVMKDSVEELLNQEKLVEVRLGYLDLLKVVRTQKARDEISHELAVMDFNEKNENSEQVEQRKKQAIQRMVAIINRADADKSTLNQFEAPVEYPILYSMSLDSTGTRLVMSDHLAENHELTALMETGKLHVDSTYKKIFSSAGLMCFEYGQEMMGKGNYEDGKFYLQRSSMIDWPGSYKPLFVLARYHSIRADARVALKNCYEILRVHKNMKPEEIKLYLNFLVNLFRKPVVNHQDAAKQIYSIYQNYINGGQIQWDVISTYLEPYKA